MVEDGTWAAVLAEVQKQSAAAGKLDWVISSGSTITRVHQHGSTLPRAMGSDAESQESVDLAR